MVLLLPRLAGPPAERLLDEFLNTGPDGWKGFDQRNLPGAVRFAATGGARAAPAQLQSLRESILKAARSCGFGKADERPDHPRFDSEVSAMLAQEKILLSGEALRDDFWTFVGVVLVPDLVRWRFGIARPRYLGGVRNTFQRMWLRGKALDRGPDHPERWGLLEELTEDALVQITERPSIGADPVLARGIGEAWVRAAGRHGRGSMEDVMRSAILKIRIRSEIRDLVHPGEDKLAEFLDEVFEAEAAIRSAASEKGDDEAKQPEVAPARAPDTASEETRVLKIVARRIIDYGRLRGWSNEQAEAAYSKLSRGIIELEGGELQSARDIFLRAKHVGVMSDEEVRLVGRIVDPVSYDSLFDGSA